jgi:DNA-binding NtrC family response regulator
MIVLDLPHLVQADVDCAIRGRTPVLLSGGSGDMRLAVARHIHRCAGRSDAAFVIASPGDAWPSSALTVFVEELAARTAADQGRLKAWIAACAKHQDNGGVRLIAATAHAPSDLVGGIGFDETLFYRLNTIHIALPTRR